MPATDESPETEQSIDSAPDEMEGPRADTPPSAVTFDWAGARAGFVTCLPVALGVACYGIAFGVLAARADLSIAEVALMSATVLAGASQIIAVELWADPVPVVTVVLAVFAVLADGRSPPPVVQASVDNTDVRQPVFHDDENCALTMRDLISGSRRGALLLGSGLAIWVFWIASTVIGVAVGGVIDDPAVFGLDFVLVATSVALAVELWDGAATAIPWAVALVTALITAQVLAGQWHVIAGGVAAAVAEVIRRD